MIMKNIIYFIIFLFSLGFINCNHVDNCLDAAKDYGVTDVYPVTKKIFDVYKDKKYLVLKNENGDTLNLTIKFSTKVRNDTVANTFKANKICTAEVFHVNILEIGLFYKGFDYYHIHFIPDASFDYPAKKITKNRDGVSLGWLDGKEDGPIIFDTYIKNPATNKIPHKTVTIHGKNVEVIDAAEISPEQVFIHEDKGIVAMIIPNHGTGYWVVDKIE